MGGIGKGWYLVLGSFTILLGLWLMGIINIVAGKGNLVFGVSLLGAYAVGHSALALVAGTSVAFVDRLAKSETTERIGQTVRLALGVLVAIAGIYLFYMGV
ncbi:MAG: hypothetical protein HPY71_06755 [Firmicutes bacterium]|nr:hypothetical protein [Bacillota bacterium]